MMGGVDHRSMGRGRLNNGKLSVETFIFRTKCTLVLRQEPVTLTAPKFKLQTKVGAGVRSSPAGRASFILHSDFSLPGTSTAAPQ